MAIPDSLTVSMGEDTSGVFRVICLVRADVRSYKDILKKYLYITRMF